jgi:hypothetical protein
MHAVQNFFQRSVIFSAFGVRQSAFSLVPFSISAPLVSQISIVENELNAAQAGGDDLKLTADG